MGQPAAPRFSSLGLPQRLALFGLLFAAEWIPISVRFHMHRGGGTLLEICVVAVSLFLAISYVRFNEPFQIFSIELKAHRIGWSFLASHALAFLAFIGLSLIPARSFTSVPGFAAEALWFGTGGLAIILAAAAFFPPRVAVQFVRTTGYVWIYALAAGLIARGLVTYSALWNGAVWNPALDLSWKPAIDFTFNLVKILLSLLLPNVFADRATMVIGTPTFKVQILPWCAGFEGTALILVFSVAWLGFFRREYRFPQAFLLIPAGMVGMWVSNAIRITALILIGVAGAPDVAGGGFHSQAGWIAFTSIALAFMVLSRRISWVAKAGPERAPAIGAAHNPSAAYLMPFLAILAAGMISTAASGAFEWLYPLRFFAAAAALWYFRSSYQRMDWRFGWLSLVAGITVFAIWVGLDGLGGSQVDRGMAASLASLPAPGRFAWLILRTTAAIVTVPIAEELAFRGFLIRRLISADFEALDPRRYTYLSVFVSSIAFGLLHGGQWLAGILAGLVFAVALLRRGRIGDAVVAHATANALLAVWVLQGGRWHLW
jgi:exosortase E/protease (VPEID-CTERM system)